MNNELVKKTRQQVFTITRQALTDLASVTLEGQSVNMFIGRLNGLEGDQKKEFEDAFKANNAPVVVNSAFDLAEKQQTEIKEAVNKILGSNSQFQFKTTPELISGIELVANGYKLAWSISEYLNSLEKSTEVKEQETPGQ
jgi:F-type H+-transporting ATPase subunit b